MSLTPKQQRFVQEYLIDLNATQAAVRAGYSQKTANQQGSRLLANVGVSAAVAAARTKVAAKADLSVEWVLERLRSVSERCMQAEPVVDKKGEAVYVETPDGGLAKAYTFQAAPATRALELLGKHMGMFAERVEHTGKDGGPIETKDMTNADLAREVAFLLTSAVRDPKTVQ